MYFKIYILTQNNNKLIIINNNFLCHCKKFIMNLNMFVTLNIVNANIKFCVQVNIVQIIIIY